MSVVITIKFASLLSDIKVRSHMTAERIKDPEEKYALRISEENESASRQALQDAWRGLIALCRPFLSTTNDASGNDQLATPPLSGALQDQQLTFDLSVRRTSHIADPLAQEIHEYLVAGTMRRFYTAAAAADIITVAAASENVARDNIVKMLYKKNKPIYT